jgi:hypothetical protein
MEQPVSSLSVSHILFLNRGGDDIKQDDIAPSDPIRVMALNNAEILGAYIARQSSPGVAPSLLAISERRYADLTFSYLGRNAGFVTTVVHTGLSSADLRVQGHILAPTD